MLHRRAFNFPVGPQKPHTHISGLVPAWVLTTTGKLHSLAWFYFTSWYVHPPALSSLAGEGDWVRVPPWGRRCGTFPGAQVDISSVQSLSRVRLFATPWTAAHQASLSITTSRSLLKLMSIKLVMPSNHLVLCCPLLLLPLIFPSITVFSKESVLHIRWPK